MKIDLTFPEHPGKTYKGTLVRTADAIDPASRTLLVEIDVDNRSGELMPGSLAQVHFKTPPVGPTFIVPAAALDLPPRRVAGGHRGRRRCCASGTCRHRRGRRRQRADRQRAQPRRPGYPGSARLAHRGRKSDRREAVTTARAREASSDEGTDTRGFAHRSAVRATSMTRSACALGGVLLVLGFSPAANPSAPTTTAPATTRPRSTRRPARRRCVPPPSPAGGAWQPANPSDGMLKGKWWEIYQDPQLNQLEERIATNNVQLTPGAGNLPGRARPSERGPRQPLSHAFGGR